MQSDDISKKVILYSVINLRLAVRYEFYFAEKRFIFF
jgi:hypothetical protein